VTAQSLADRTGNAKQRESLVIALERYLSSFSGPQQAMRELAYREIALTREEAVDKSETSLKIWRATIQTPVDALLAYHESGLKPADLMQLLQAIGLGSIAARIK
jgi:hypothetical protein